MTSAQTPISYQIMPKPFRFELSMTHTQSTWNVQFFQFSLIYSPPSNSNDLVGCKVCVEFSKLVFIQQIFLITSQSIPIRAYLNKSKTINIKVCINEYNNLIRLPIIF